MAKSDYITQNDDTFNAQLQTFKNIIANYSTLHGVTPAQIATQAADADYFDYTLKCMKLMTNGALQWTGWKNLERAGGTAPASGAPVAPVFSMVVPAVAPGIEVRFRVLVQLIKANPNYNETIGLALGIEGAQQTGPNLSTVQPVFIVKISGGRVEISWGWGGNAAFLDVCEIQVDRGDGKGYGLLTYDTTPGYVDTQPFPATPTKWTYKAIYHVGDAQVGQWSNPVSITVGG